MLFGTMGFFSYIKESTDKEPFEFLEEIEKRTEENAVTVFIEDISVIAYAGINSHLDSMDKPQVAKERVRKWCNALTMAQLSEIFQTSIKALSTGEPKPRQESSPQSA